MTTKEPADKRIVPWKTFPDEVPKEGQKVLAVYRSKPETSYNCRADGWFRDTVYSCRYVENKFIIESHGPIFVPTHWMESPTLPEWELLE